jgi:hypothetical protein
MSSYILPCGNEDVVHVDEEFSRVFVQKRFKQLTHSLTEGARGVIHAKRHSSRFEQPKRSLEGSLPLVFVFHSNVIETPAQIHFSEDPFPLKAVNDTTY